jgi:Type II secretion system protein C
MPRHLFMVNALLGLVAAGFAAYIGWQMMRPLKNTTPVRPRTTSSASPSTLPAPSAREGGSGAWTTIASRNLFSPTRSETGGSGAAAAIQQGPKPSLYGVVLRDGAPIAYLEDPATRRVAAYRVGDTVGGGIVKSISADGVVLTRPDGQLDVRLHDPAKPRPPVPAQPQGGVTPPGAQPQPAPQPSAEGVPPPPTQMIPPQQPPQPFRRPIPPNLIRRLPQVPGEPPAQSDAPTQ